MLFTKSVKRKDNGIPVLPITMENVVGMDIAMVTADDAMAVGNADDAMAIGNADDAMAIGNADDVMTIGKVDDAVVIRSADDVMAVGIADDTTAIGKSDHAIVKGTDQENEKKYLNDISSKVTPWYGITLTNNDSPGSQSSKYNGVSDENDDITEDIADFIKNEQNLDNAEPMDCLEVVLSTEKQKDEEKDAERVATNVELNDSTISDRGIFEYTDDSKSNIGERLNLQSDETGHNAIEVESEPSKWDSLKEDTLKSEPCEENDDFNSCSNEGKTNDNSQCSFSWIDSSFAKQTGSFERKTNGCDTDMNKREVRVTVPERYGCETDIKRREVRVTAPEGNGCDTDMNKRKIRVSEQKVEEDSQIEQKAKETGSLNGVNLKVESTFKDLEACCNADAIDKQVNEDSRTLSVAECDSETETLSEFSHNPQLSKALSESKNDLMKFAEILYKCTLCTSIPSILTSKSSFLQHVTDCHLTTQRSFEMCKKCSLKFRTEEDLKEHVQCLHTGNCFVNEVKPFDTTGSDVIPEVSSGNSSPNEVIKSLDRLIDNESDSDSSGHRQFKAKAIRRSKPQHDFENPKQLVDHAGIETLNGSLDLSKKDLASAKNVHIHSDNSLTCNKKSPRSKEVVNLVTVHQITDQIMKSNVQNKNSVGSPNGQKIAFTPSFTPEFGKFTKLVREGGNIVYFCQVCNWKSPVKSTFQVHCSTGTHKAKVLSAEDPESSSDASNPIPNSKTPNTDGKIPNICVGNVNDTKFSREAGFWPTQGRPCMSNLPDGSMFYNYIRPRGVAPKISRTPVVSPYRNGGFEERSDFSYRRHFENAVDFALKKKKKTAFTPIKGSHTNHYNSDSDSDSKSSNNQESHWRNHSANMSLLRSKLLQGHSENHVEMTSLNAVRNNLSLPHELSLNHSTGTYELNHQASPGAYLADDVNLDLSIVKTEKQDIHESLKTVLPFSSKRKSYDGHESSQKKLKELLLGKNKESERDTKVKQTEESLYKCHACPFEYSDIDQYENHFEKVHKSSTSYAGSPGESPGAYQRSWLDKVVCSGGQGKLDGQVTPSDSANAASSENLEMGENWRVQKLKEILPDYLVTSEKGNTSRDYLLQCISVTAGIPDAGLWSSACNKAMREVYPNSLAQRKGKHKKTYYFGVSMVESFQGQEEVTQIEADGGGQVYQPLRDINIDMEKIIEHLPAIVKWTGCMEAGVYRGEILMVLADLLQDQGIQNWGAQCNRAIRLVFPMVDMKRKGKFKTTIYFGVDLHSTVRQSLARHNHTESYLPLYGDTSMNNPLQKGTETEFQNEESLGRNDNSPVATTNGQNGGRDPSETVSVYPQWFKQEARSEMEEYLAKFGGVTMFDETCSNGGDAVNDDDNDGDDEGGSVDSGVTT